MKRLGHGLGLGLVLGALLARPVLAQERPIPSGYAFDRPQLLAQQLIWGKLHGVRLLALACHRRGDRAATSAYVAWLEHQSPQIRSAERALSRHYFGRDLVPMEAIDRALNLQPVLAQADETLGDACATLPAALATPRYDLERFDQESTQQ